MKKPLEITLKELHRGAWKSFTTLKIGKDDSVSDFLAKLAKSNPAAFNQLRATMEVIASEEHFRNPRKFKSVGEGINEIRLRSGIRLYTFTAKIEGLPQPQLIVATNGGKKNTSKEQQRDIKKARKIREQFLAAQDQEDTTLEFEELTENED